MEAGKLEAFPECLIGPARQKRSDKNAAAHVAIRQDIFQHSTPMSMIVFSLRRQDKGEPANHLLLKLMFAMLHVLNTEMAASY